MKNLSVLLFSILILASCGTTDGVGQLSRKERKLQKQMHIREALSNRHYSIRVNSAHPLGHPVIMLSTPYNVEVRGDSIISYLPYFGTAYNIPYGGGKGLNFSAPISGYEDVQIKPGEHAITISVRNEEDIYVYYLQVFESGGCSINVRMRQRTEISFNGEVDME